MGTRSTYLRRIEQFEAAVIGFGRGVAQRRPGTRAAHHRAIDRAVDALTGSPLAEPEDVRRIRTAQDVDFHVRHIDRLLETPAAKSEPRPELRAALEALESALTAFETRDSSRLDRLDRAIERILETAERPLLRDGAASAPDARLRRIALHVLAIAEASRSRVPSGVSRPAAPVA
jgi:DNA-binding transcriptional MerR regulator